MFLGGVPAERAMRSVGRTINEATKVMSDRSQWCRELAASVLDSAGLHNSVDLRRVSEDRQILSPALPGCAECLAALSDRLRGHHIRAPLRRRIRAAHRT